MKTRPLKPDETVRAGDLFQNLSALHLPWSDIGASFADKPQRNWEGTAQWHRPLKHNWISFKDRKPTKEDADVTGLIVVRLSSGSAAVFRWDETWKGHSYYWMPTNFDEEISPIKVDGHEILPQKDGSVKLSCGTIIPKEDMEELLRQRNEVMQ